MVEIYRSKEHSKFILPVFSNKVGLSDVFFVANYFESEMQNEVNINFCPGYTKNSFVTDPRYVYEAAKFVNQNSQIIDKVIAFNLSIVQESLFKMFIGFENKFIRNNKIPNEFAGTWENFEEKYHFTITKDFNIVDHN